MIKININVIAISGQGQSGFRAQAMLGCAMITGLMDTSGLTAQQVGDACVDDCKLYLPDADYTIHLP